MITKERKEELRTLLRPGKTHPFKPWDIYCLEKFPNELLPDDLSYVKRSVESYIGWSKSLMKEAPNSNERTRLEKELNDGLSYAFVYAPRSKIEVAFLAGLLDGDHQSNDDARTIKTQAGVIEAAMHVIDKNKDDVGRAKDMLWVQPPSEEQETKKGRPRARSIATCQKLKAEWEQAKDAGVKKSIYCTDKGITVGDLDSAIRSTRRK